MITGNEPITAVLLRQTGEKTFRVASEKDSKEGQFLKSELGLTKREHFAAMAMQGLCTQRGETQYNVNGLLHIESVAKESVAIADALIAELNKEVKP